MKSVCPPTKVTTVPGVKSTLWWSKCLIERNGREKDVIASIGHKSQNIQCYEIVTNESTLQITHLETTIYLSLIRVQVCFQDFRPLGYSFAESNLFKIFFARARAAEDVR